MFGLKKLGYAALISVSLLTVGCASAKPGPSTQIDAKADVAVRCDKCDATWVKVPTDNGKGRVVAYTTRKEMVCPDCKDAVATFFATGKLHHSCKACGDNLQICESH